MMSELPVIQSAATPTLPWRFTNQFTVWKDFLHQLYCGFTPPRVQERRQRAVLYHLYTMKKEELNYERVESRDITRHMEIHKIKMR